MKMAALGAAPLDQEDRICRLWPARIAIDRMRASRHSLEDWEALRDAINLLEALGRATGLVRHWRQWHEEAEATFASAYLRQHQTGSNVFTPTELDVLGHAVGELARALEVATMRELFTSDQHIARKRAQLQRGNAKGVKTL